MSFFSVLFKQLIRQQARKELRSRGRWSSMKWTNCESSDSEEVYKMRRAVFILVFCSLVLITQSVLSQQSWKDFVDNQDEKKESLRLTGMSWSPSDITVTFKKKIQNLTNSYRQGRALVATTAIQKQQFPISQSATVKKTRSNDSGGRDVGDSGKCLSCFTCFMLQR